ncbi:MAG: hypothetical protein Q9195_008879 [Heterodermia aff. obscurata]
MAGTVDNYLWDIENVTALCTTDCLSSASSWFSDVKDQCTNDLMNVNGRLVPPVSIPGRIVDGMNIACLTPSTDVSLNPGINGSLISSTVLSDTGSSVSADTTTPSAGSSSSTRKRQASGSGSSGSSSTSFCLIESYNWVGSDIIRPDCSGNSATNSDGSSQCVDPNDVPAENERIANLYPDSLLCSDCFLKMFYLRVASPYLPDLDYSDYLVGQYFDIVDVCQAQMPDLLVRLLPYYDYTPGFLDSTLETSDSGTKSSGTSAVACNQTLTADELGQLTVPDPNANGSIYCDALSEKYGVTTGDLQLAFGSYHCLPPIDFTSVCVPAGCTLMQVPENATCDSMAESISTAQEKVTAYQLTTWNPNLQGFCNQLKVGQYACISAPGGSYVSPPVINSTTDAGTQQRGGGVGSGTATGSGGPAGGGRKATIVSPGGPAPSPTQSGISPQCTEYVQAQSGDGCFSLATLWQISEEDLYAYNSILGASGADCSTQLFSGFWYCIGIPGASSTTTSAPGTVPSPVQSGIDVRCTSYAKAKSGDFCTAFAAGNNITPAQLYLWNPVLGPNGEKCDTLFQANEFYCIGAPTAPRSTSISMPAAPTPTQSGIASNCNKYAKAIVGDTCFGFAQANEITTDQLYGWNTVLGSGGSQCSTQFQANTYYYWNEQCFADFVSSTHPNLANNESEIQLLWGCFKLHACHPFPAIATNNRIDFSAFTRAAALLAVQGTDLLGTQDEGDILWRKNEADSRQADFRRMFSAIGQEKENLSEELKDHHGTTSAVEDVMDVLAMTQPFAIGVLPSPDQLEPTARNLLANFPGPWRRQLPNHELPMISPRILRAISLFIPPTELPGSSQDGSKDKIVVFRVLSESHQSSDDLTCKRLVKALAKDSRPHLILITEQTTEDDPATVMGAYCPNTLFPSGKDPSLTPPLLFQLTPELHIASWTNHPKPPTGFIHGGDDNDTMAKNSKPFWIGALDRKCPCLSIDPGTKSVTFTSTPMKTDFSLSTGLGPVDEMVWKSTAQPAQLEVLSVVFG